MKKENLRVAYGKYIVKAAKNNKNIIALEADLKDSTRSVCFQNAYPGRYIECRVAEQNMAGVAAGLALAGKIPIVHSFACFISMRSCEQIRTSIAYPKLNVKFIASHSGISAGSAGTTHHSIEDIAIMRAIPNMVVIAPGDIMEMQRVIDKAISYFGPVYIRLDNYDVENSYYKNKSFQIGGSIEVRSGKDASIIATGTIIHEAISASEILLKKFGIKARVLQMASIKPIDTKAIIRAVRETGNIVTVEEHNILGGLGSAVGEVAGDAGGVKLKRMGINDHFCEVGSASYLRKKEGLTAEGIAGKVAALLKK